MRENVALKEENSRLKKETKSLKVKLSSSKARMECVSPRAQAARREKAGLARDEKESPTKTIRRIIHSRVSLRQYASLRGKGMPSATKVKRRERFLRNKAAKGVETPSATSSRRGLRAACQEAVSRAGFSEKPQTYWVKVSGDGTYCRQTGFIQLTLELVRPRPAKRFTVTLACVKGDETHDNPDLKAIFEEFDREIGEIQELDGVPVKFYFGADLKFMWLVLGLGSGISDHPCPYCSVHKSQKHMCTGDPRNIEQMCKRADKNFSRLKAPQRESQKGVPLLKSIPIKNFIFDEMHMVLRVFDRIFGKIKSKLATLGQIKRLNDEMKRILGRNVTLNENILLSTRLNLSDRELLLKNMTVGLPGLEECGRYFMVIVESVREMCKKGKVFSSVIRKMCEKWRALYHTHNQDGDFTPYMHLLVFHLPEILDHVGYFFHDFNQQIVELANVQLRSDAERLKYDARSLVVQQVKRQMLNFDAY